MKRSYWEKMAPNYNDEIFDVLQNDKKALICSAIRQMASKNKTVIDMGCAIGKWLPVLSPQFKKVWAIDISAKNLAIAQQLYPQYKNVDYIRANISSSMAKLPKADAAICINAILTASQKDRDIFFTHLSVCLKKGGQIIISVPALESWLLTSIIQQQFKIDASLFPKTKNSALALQKWNNIKQGNVDIDEVPHKHYLKDELQLLMHQNGFANINIEKITYDWSTEFIKVPAWLKEPQPWDWMVTAKKS